MAREADAILMWTDEEATGLDLDDHVLELAVVFTDTQLNELGSFETLVRPQPTTFARIASLPVVADMHTRSGLLSELTSADPASLPDIGQVEAALLAAIDQVAKSGQMVMMAGGGVSHFDIGHLGHWMPGLRERLHYGTVDISDVVRGYIAATGNPDTFAKDSTKTHRAMDDVRGELGIAPLIWDMYQQYDARRLTGTHKPTAAERILAGASIIQAASSVTTDEELTAVLDEYSARDTIAGVTVVATELLRMLSERTGTSAPEILTEMRMRVLR